MGTTGHVPLPKELRRRFWRLIAAGYSTEAAAAALGVDHHTGLRWFIEAGGIPPMNLAQPKGRYLSFSEREEIALDRAAGLGMREIARRLGRSPSTISREIAAA
jgi:IS30 family transposase